MKSWSRRAPLFLPLMLLPFACDRSKPPPPIEHAAAAPFREAFERLGFSPEGNAHGCVECHLGMIDPALAIAATEFRFVDADLQKRAEAAYPQDAERVRVIHTLMAHPKPDLAAGPRSPHADLDCVACHVTTDRSAELPPDRVKEWEKFHLKRHPLLPEVALRIPQRTEAVCLRCHQGQDPLPGADLLNRGRVLYERMGCHTCHITPGLKTRDEDLVEGERRVRKPGPPLTSLADKVDKPWANAWLYHPAHFKPTARMPAFFPRGQIGLPPQIAANVPAAQLERFERVVAACVIEYLFDRSTPANLPDPPPDLLETVDWKIEDQRDRGRRLVEDLGCLACHRVEEEYPPEFKKSQSFLEEEFATNLAGSGEKFGSPRGVRWLYHWLKDPPHWFPETVMPRFRLTDAQIGDLIQSLLSLKIDNAAREARKLDPWRPREPQIEEPLLNSLLAYQQGPVESPLRDKVLWEGRKVVETFGCYACHSMGGEWDRKPVMEGGITKDLLPGTGVMERMPMFDMNAVETNAVVTYLWAQHEAIGSPWRRDARAEGARVLEKYNCAGCHVTDEVRVFVRQPDAGIAAADVRYKDRAEAPARWFVEWLREPATLRPPPVAARFPEALPESAIDRFTPARGGTFATRRMAVAAPEEREALEYRMPPSLRTAGRKFRPAWLRAFLQNPERLRPGDAPQMPTFRFEEGEIDALVEYLRIRDGARPEDEAGRLAPSEIEARIDRLISAEARVRKDCVSCHAVEGRGRALSVDLATLHPRLQRPWLRALMEEPATVYPRTVMPKFEWKPGELDDMVDLLLNYDRVRAAKAAKGGPAALVEALESEEPAIVARALERAAAEAGLAEAAVRALGIVRARREGPRERVEALLAHEAASVRRAAVEALAALRASPDRIAERVDDPDRAVRRAAISALGAMEGGTRFSAAVARRLQDEFTDVRELALRTLVQLGARDQMPAVAAAVRDRDPLLRRAAIDALVGFDAVDQAPAVAAALKDSEASVRVRAAEALGGLGARDSLEALRGAAGDLSNAVRWAALMSIARLGGAPVEEALQDEDPQIRAAAGVALLRQGRGREGFEAILRERPYEKMTELAAMAGVSLLAGRREGRVEPGRRTVDEWLKHLGAEPVGRSELVTIHRGDMAEVLIEVALSSKLAFVERGGKLALVPLDEAVAQVLGEKR